MHRMEGRRALSGEKTAVEADSGVCPGHSKTTSAMGPDFLKTSEDSQGTQILKEWLLRRKDNPYPSPSEKKELMLKAGMTRSQLDHWFTNARQRYVKPKNRRGPNPNYSRYPQHVTDVLIEWLTHPNNMEHPYPSTEEQQELMDKTGLTRRQLQNWFTNARKRNLAGRVLVQRYHKSSTTKNTVSTPEPVRKKRENPQKRKRTEEEGPQLSQQAPAMNSFPSSGSISEIIRLRQLMEMQELQRKHLQEQLIVKHHEELETKQLVQGTMAGNFWIPSSSSLQSSNASTLSAASLSSIEQQMLVSALLRQGTSLSSMLSTPSLPSIGSIPSTGVLPQTVHFEPGTMPTTPCSSRVTSASASASAPSSTPTNAKVAMLPRQDSPRDVGEVESLEKQKGSDLSTRSTQEKGTAMTVSRPTTSEPLIKRARIEVPSLSNDINVQEAASVMAELLAITKCVSSDPHSK